MTPVRRTAIPTIILIISLVLVFMDTGFRTIWPSVAALLLVFSARNVLMGLLGGAVVGSLLLCEGRFWEIPYALAADHLLPNFQSPWKSGAIVFTLILGGFVHLLERGGILQNLLARLLHGHSRRKVETGAGIFGIICFFDGLANSLMVGRIFQPMADRSGVSRVRLAYIVDTTSAAVACLAFVSTWIAYQLAMIREGFALAGMEAEAQPYRLFFLSLPHNYYAWFALLLLVVVIARQWNLGPMREFEKETVRAESTGSMDATEPAAGLWRAWLPVAVLLGTLFSGIYADGTHRMGTGMLPFSWSKLALSFSEANVPVIMVAGSGMAALLAWILFPRRSDDAENKPGTIFMEGMLQLFQPVLILVVAWMLSSTLNDLHAADYLGHLLGGRLSPGMFPLAVFLLGSLVAFTTGTSWGTMGLLMPLAIPLAFSITGGSGEAHSLIPLVIGAVFSGAVFGDHCSPISDTTIVSSIACGVDPLDHVRTQLPYALLAAAGAALIGFPLAGLTGGSIPGSFTAAGLYLLLILAFAVISERLKSQA